MTGDLPPPVDLDRLRRRFDDDGELLAEIFRVFRAEAPGRHAAMGAALAAGDMEQLAHHAHSLRGVAGTLFAEALGTAAYELELAARAADPDCPRLAGVVLARLDAAVRFLEPAP